MFFPLRRSIVCSRLKFSLFHLHSLPTNLPSKTINLTHKFQSLTHQILHELLEKCSSMKELKILHAQIMIHNLSTENLTLGKLISFCAIDKSGDLEYAQLVFDHILVPNKFMYNSLIRGYSNSDDPVKAIALYFRMINSGVPPNEFTLPFVLKACACRVLYWEALIVHSQGIRIGIGSQVCVQNALINVYASCGWIRGARHMFDEISERTLVSWNSMIGGYARIGFCKEAFLLFREMRELGLNADDFTLVNLLSVCSKICDLDLGKCLHLYIEISGIETDQIARNALLDMYAKCGDLYSAETVFGRMHDKNVVSRTCMVNAYSKHGLIGFARRIFDQISEKNVISWNSMISCYVIEGQCKEALLLFDKMICDSSVTPEETTLISVLSACGQIGDLVVGEKIHNYVYNNNIELTTALSNSLIDMYAKCSALKTALDLFYQITGKTVVSWNVIIRALALHGCGFEAIELFNMMQASGVRPDEITFTGLLSACSHSGFVEAGQFHFKQMSSLYGILPEIEHYACMVDILGRGGFLEEAIELIGKMPMKPDLVVWGALLGACRIYGYVEIAKLILKQLLELEPYSSGVYVLLSNMYCEAKRWDDMKKIRKLMNDGGIVKCKAVSSVEVDGSAFEFMVDDKRVESSLVYRVLDQLTGHLKSVGYCCNLSNGFLDVEEI